MAKTVSYSNTTQRAVAVLVIVAYPSMMVVYEDSMKCFYYGLLHTFPTGRLKGYGGNKLKIAILAKIAKIHRAKVHSSYTPVSDRAGVEGAGGTASHPC